MPALRISRAEKNGVYFVTFTVKNWYYLFDRHQRFEILENSFVYCQKHKGLKIYAYVFILNHIHFLASADDLSAVIRDMKTFLSKEMKRNILATEPNIISLFENESGVSFWEPGNYPELVESEAFFLQKLQYINENPVRKQYVWEPEDWRWSSASKIPGNIVLEALEV